MTFLGLLGPFANKNLPKLWHDHSGYLDHWLPIWVDSGFGVGVSVLPAEIVRTLYRARPEDWGGDRDSECDRISAELSQVMKLKIGQPFASPVDLNLFPYPMDISTIKARLDNRFYRRASAVEFDVRYIFTNANKFNQPESGVVRSASVITELCLEIIRNRNSASATSVSKYGMLVEEADEAVTEPNTSGASAETTSNIRCRSRRNSHTESESEEDFSEPQSRNGVDISKSKVNFCKFYVIEIVIHTC